MPAVPSPSQLLDDILVHRSTIANSSATDAAPVLKVVCAWPVSGQYGPGTRVLYIFPSNLDVTAMNTDPITGTMPWWLPASLRARPNGFVMLVWLPCYSSLPSGLSTELSSQLSIKMVRGWPCVRENINCLLQSTIESDCLQEPWIWMCMGLFNCVLSVF